MWATKNVQISQALLSRSDKQLGKIRTWVVLKQQPIMSRNAHRFQCDDTIKLQTLQDIPLVIQHIMAIITSLECAALAIAKAFYKDNF